jgi:hypothetical protein
MILGSPEFVQKGIEYDLNSWIIGFVAPCLTGPCLILAMGPPAALFVLV